MVAPTWRSHLGWIGACGAEAAYSAAIRGRITLQDSINVPNETHRRFERFGFHRAGGIQLPAVRAELGSVRGITGDSNHLGLIKLGQF